MPQRPDRLTPAQAAAAIRKHGGRNAAARALGVSHAVLSYWLKPPAPTRVAAAALDVGEIRAARTAQHDAATLRLLRRKLADAAEAADFFDAIPRCKPIVAATSKRKTGRRPGTIVTIASDWHFGEVVTAEETNGGNVYNMRIAHERAARFWANVLWLREDILRTVDSPDHVLSLNGDMISGSIHPELLATNDGGITTQVGEVCGALEAGIRQLAPKCRRLVIPCIHGNHGRSSLKSHMKDGFENSAEAMMYRFLRGALRDVPNIEWLIPRAESVMVEVQGRRLRFQHGTFLRSQGGVGGILVPLSRWAHRMSGADHTRADWYVFGHFHQACTFGQVVVNGSLIGDSSYNLELGLSSRPAEQVNFVIDAAHGLRRFDPVSVT